MAKKKVKQVDSSAAVEHVMDTDTKVNIGILGGWNALASEVYKDGEFEGTVLYVPGATLKQIKEG